MRIGYIGVGNMGGALARRLHQSHNLHVFDLSQAARIDRLGDALRTQEAIQGDLADLVDDGVPCPPKHPRVFTHDKRKAHYGQLDQDTGNRVV